MTGPVRSPRPTLNSIAQKLKLRQCYGQWRIGSEVDRAATLGRAEGEFERAATLRRTEGEVDRAAALGRTEGEVDRAATLGRARGSVLLKRKEPWSRTPHRRGSD